MMMMNDACRNAYRSTCRSPCRNACPKRLPAPFVAPMCAPSDRVDAPRSKSRASSARLWARCRQSRRHSPSLAAAAAVGVILGVLGVAIVNDCAAGSASSALLRRASAPLSASSPPEAGRSSSRSSRGRALASVLRRRAPPLLPGRSPSTAHTPAWMSAQGKRSGVASVHTREAPAGGAHPCRYARRQRQRSPGQMGARGCASPRKRRGLAKSAEMTDPRTGGDDALKRAEAHKRARCRSRRAVIDDDGTSTTTH